MLAVCAAGPAVAQTPSFTVPTIGKVCDGNEADCAVIARFFACTRPDAVCVKGCPGHSVEGCAALADLHASAAKAEATVCAGGRCMTDAFGAEVQAPPWPSIAHGNGGIILKAPKDVAAHTNGGIIERVLGSSQVALGDSGGVLLRAPLNLGSVDLLGIKPLNPPLAPPQSGIVIPEYCLLIRVEGPDQLPPECRGPRMLMLGSAPNE